MQPGAGRERVRIPPTAFSGGAAYQHGFAAAGLGLTHPRAVLHLSVSALILCFLQGPVGQVARLFTALMLLDVCTHRASPGAAP